MHFAVPWGRSESALYDLLIDDPLADPWHIVDLLDHEGLKDVAVDDARMDATVDLTRKCVDYVNSELESNPQVIPPEVLREMRYPRIRQMRDVHQFDVGSHLALCHAYAVRCAPVRLAERLGCEEIAGLLRAAIEDGGCEAFGLPAVFHDFFKCFRPRRPLPAKLGEPTSLSWRLPSGEPAGAVEAAREDVVACEVLPHFLDDTAAIRRTTDSIRFSDRFGSLLYRMLGQPDPRRAGEIADEFWREHASDPIAPSGLYLSVTDWLGKGWAQDLVTHRKGRARSLREAGHLALAHIERALR